MKKFFKNIYIPVALIVVIFSVLMSSCSVNNKADITAGSQGSHKKQDVTYSDNNKDSNINKPDIPVNNDYDYSESENISDDSIRSQEPSTDGVDNNSEETESTQSTGKTESVKPSQNTTKNDQKKTAETDKKDTKPSKPSDQSQDKENKPAVDSNKNDKNDADIKSEDFYWLSRIIHAEAGGEPYEGKLAVGTVVMNRVKSPEFPSNIHDVIFDTKYGVQFTPAANGTIYNTPSEESCRAAMEILEGYSLNDDIMYFVNHNISTSQWFYTLKFEFRIGNHWFYSDNK